MSTQRKLLAILLLLAAALALLLGIALRSGAPLPAKDPLREGEPAPKAQMPSEPTESAAERSALGGAPARPASAAKPVHQPGPPVRIVGRIGDGHGAPLEATNVLVYDSRGEMHQPEVLRPDWYECTLNERGRTLVFAVHEGNCDAQVPLELMELDVERNVALVLPARPELRIHVRDLEGKPLPRFGKGQPLRERLRAAASLEELPAQLPVQLALHLAGGSGAQRLAWGEFEPESLMHALSTRAGLHLPGAPRGRPPARNRRRSTLPASPALDLDWNPGQVDDEQFDRGIASLREQYKRRFETDGQVPEGDAQRQFLAALGYIGEAGAPIEGESPERDLVGTLTLARPLPLRVSLLAGQTLLESRDPVPWTEDLLFKVDLQRLEATYVHAWLFVKDAQTGARLPGVRVHLRVEQLPGGLELPEEFASRVAEGYAGQEAPEYIGAPKGWRYPEGDVLTDLDGRADFKAALPGWWELSLAAGGHVPMKKWVFVERGAECYLDFFELAPLATSRLQVRNPEGAGVRADFEVRPLLHARESEGLFETWPFQSDDAGLLELQNVGRQLLLLRSADHDWALEPLLLDNTRGLVDNSELQVLPAHHVLIHLPASLPWTATVHVAQGLTRAVHEDAFAGKTLIDLWLADGTYTLRVAEGFTALLTTKFTVAGEPMLVEIDR
jgi:hypothetical protein